MHLDLPIEWLPASGAAEQLLLLLHGGASTGAAMAPLAQALRAEFPQAAVLAPDAPLASDAPLAPAGHPVPRDWIPGPGPCDDANAAGAVSDLLPPFMQWVRQTQQRLGVGAAATALAGFSQGGILALEAALAQDGLVGRVLSFSGRFVSLPVQAPRHTTVHLFHGGADITIDAFHSRAALQLLAQLHGDATLDIAEVVGHEMHPALIQRALFRLRNHIPARTWAAALGSVPRFELPSQDH